VLVPFVAENPYAAQLRAFVARVGEGGGFPPDPAQRANVDILDRIVSASSSFPEPSRSP
jgi:hypothetical protein